MKNKSAEEINLLIAKLRECLKDVLPSNPKFDNDFYLYRWLILYQMKIDRTETAIRKSIKWRETVNLEELAERDWAFFAPGLENEYVFDFEGISKIGQPVATSIVEKIDGRKLMDKYGKEAPLRFFIQFLAKVEKAMMDRYKYGPTEETLGVQKSKNKCENYEFRPTYNPSWDTAAVVYAASYNNFPLRNLTCLEGIQLFLEGARIGMTYFPTILTAVYVLNLNKYAATALKLLKPIIASDCFSIDVFDTDKSKWSKELLERIDSDQLTPYFGGTRATLQDQPK